MRAYLAECWDRPEGLSPTHLQAVHFISSQSSITTSCGDSALLLDEPASALGPCRHDRAHTRLGDNGMARSGAGRSDLVVAVGTSDAAGPTEDDHLPARPGDAPDSDARGQPRPPPPERKKKGKKGKKESDRGALVERGRYCEASPSSAGSGAASAEWYARYCGAVPCYSPPVTASNQMECRNAEGRNAVREETHLGAERAPDKGVNVESPQVVPAAKVDWIGLDWIRELQDYQNGRTWSGDVKMMDQSYMLHSWSNPPKITRSLLPTRHAEWPHRCVGASPRATASWSAVCELHTLCDTHAWHAHK